MDNKTDSRKGAKLTYTNPHGWVTYWNFENGNWVGRTSDGVEIGIPLSTILNI